MKESLTKGLICLRDDLDIEYKIASITYIEREDESFSYIFIPFYNVIDLLGFPIFQGIPGLNLDLRREKYVRDNRVPVFISERSPGKNREDLWELLEEVGMNYLNPLEWLIRTDTRYGGDRFYVKRYMAEDEAHCVTVKEDRGLERSASYSRYLLDLICHGHDVITEFYTIDDSNRKEYYSLLMTLYRKDVEYQRSRQKDGVKKGAAQGNYRGRARIQMDELNATEVFESFRERKITETEALKKLGISRATFYRRLKEYGKI